MPVGMLEWIEAHQLPCLFKAVFGIDCPGCGFQRAVLFLLKGEWEASLAVWPGLLPLLTFLLLTGLRMAGLKKIGPGLLKNAGFVCLIIILISYLFHLIVNNH